MDLSSLLKPISEDAPCGPDPDNDPTLAAAWVHYMEEDVAKQEAKWTDYLYDTDPESKAKPPAWNPLRSETFNLASKTKHLQLAAILTECLALTEGLEGLRDGLQLCFQWCTTYWDQLYPSGSPLNRKQARKNCLEHLKSPGVLLRFQRLPLATIYDDSRSRAIDGPFGLADYTAAVNSLPDADTASRVQATFANANQADLQSTKTLVEEVARIAKELEALFKTHEGGENLNLTELIEYLGHCLRVVKAQIKGETGGETAGEEATNPATGTAPSAKAAPGFSSTGGALSSRKAAVATLQQVIAYFESAEPSSPVPLLLRRAQRCVGKSFMEIVDELGQDRSQVENILKPIIPPAK